MFSLEIRRANENNKNNIFLSKNPYLQKIEVNSDYICYNNYPYHYGISHDV